jgi:hypothetical protein
MSSLFLVQTYSVVVTILTHGPYKVVGTLRITPLLSSLKPQQGMLERVDSGVDKYLLNE